MATMLDKLRLQMKSSGIHVVEPINTIKFYIREEPYGFLSNFWRHAQTLMEKDDGFFDVHREFSKLLPSTNIVSVYRTNEHFYQACKAKDKKMSEWIRDAPTATQAMKAGRSLSDDQIRDDWEKIKVRIMKAGLRAKFRDENLALMLLWTGDAVLIEDSPTDMFWGGSLPGSKNMLGQLLMEVREEIRKDRK